MICVQYDNMTFRLLTKFSEMKFANHQTDIEEFIDKNITVQESFLFSVRKLKVQDHSTFLSSTTLS